MKDQINKIEKIIVGLDFKAENEEIEIIDL